MLRSDDGRRLERLDFCPECWQVMKNEAYESFWITRRERKDKAIPRLSKRERATALRVLFESLWDRREEEDLAAHLFFLSHLLMKWGGLKWRENSSDIHGNEVVVFEDPASGDLLEIGAAPLDDDRLLAIKEEVEGFLRQYAAEGQEISL
ncbi:MAG TPA: hypothetical protein PLS90_10140 [Candidatus Sumerlaeota bacterium]|nr:hypothetical protein [Candidatus Sumerlaeota bacterium]